MSEPAPPTHRALKGGGVAVVALIANTLVLAAATRALRLGIKIIRGLHRGHTRAIIAAAFVVTLLLLQFDPPHGQPELVASMRTLSIAVLAFYFGSQTSPRDKQPGGQ